ncbi:MAG: ABC transporter ATP-binding protein [Elusimicrobia bacterium]|nr:ABC transporter ATP-binding protein [Elusimicrobiota bacterium]
MSADAAVVAEGLGKRFRIAARDERRTVLGRLRRALTGAPERRELWALRDLDLEIRRGEIFGVIGANGAGKSTLLLLLAGILAPTRGSLRVEGKTDPFFQFAAGLRPQLSVLDNMALCAALLGLTRREFKRRLPQIVEFSGLGDYLYARYGELSTGLAARLPFATAIHADLDIIVIDEMLSVGDRAFQAQCLEAFRGLADRGKTLIVVSHNLDLVAELCGRALYLKEGRAAYCGKAGTAVARLIADSGG